MNNSVEAGSKLAEPRKDGLETFAAGLKIPPTGADRQKQIHADKASADKSKLVGSHAFATRLGLKHSEFSNAVASGIFPKPSHSGAAGSYWSESAVEKACAARSK